MGKKIMKHRDDSPTTPTKSLVIAGLSGGSGKSVVSIGLIAAMREQDLQVVAFKKGPDYIDAGWLSRAAGRPCYNLDPYLMSPADITASFCAHAAAMDIAVIEGNRGLYDGVNPEGGYSTAELAVQLDLPVLLVVNCSKTTRTIAALVLGCRKLDPRVRIGGVILNQIATPRHESIIRQAVERYTDVPVLGIVPRLKRDIFPMRHLGVTPHQEYDAADEAIARLADIAREHFDLLAIGEMMSRAQTQQTQPAKKRQCGSVRSPERLTVGILRDAAFQFYYQENLDALHREGAKLVMIDALKAESLPLDLDGLYIGGGFPETSAGQLAANVSFRNSVKAAADQGLPLYAECGGLIFLGQSIVLDGRSYPLAGVFPITFGISRKPQAHGYSIFIAEKNNPFYPVGTRVKGHEFRYSTILDWPGNPEDLVLKMERGTGFMAGRDGLVYNNVLALYTHIIAPGTPEWAQGFLDQAAAHARRRKQNS